MCSFRARRVRWWYQADRAWWRRRQASQWVAAPGGGGWASRRPVSGTVSGIMPGSAGGGWSGRTGAGARVSVRWRSSAAVTAQIARAAMASTVCRAIAVEPDLGLVQAEAEQPLHPVRRPVPGPPGQRPAVTPGQIAHQCGGVLARLQPRLHPGETRAQQFQQLIAFPPAQPGAYPGGSSRLRFCCLHTRIIARRLRHAKTYAMLSSRSNPEWSLPY
jgi:hypothetical protein